MVFCYYNKMIFVSDIFDCQSLSPRVASQQKESGTTHFDKTLISPDSPRSVSEKYVSLV